MNRQSIEAELIRIRRTIALDLKAIADLEKRILRKRNGIAALKRDEANLEGKLKKARA